MEDLHSLKYAELRKRAKEAGIKANQKQEKLIAELTAYYKKTPVSEEPKNVNTPPKTAPSKNQKVKDVTLKPRTPLAKPATPILKKVLTKTATPTQKVASPRAALNSPATKKLTPVPKKGSVKRKQTSSPSTPQPVVKKRRSTFEKAPTPDLSAPNVATGRRSTFEKKATPNLTTPEIKSPSRRQSKGRSPRGSPGVNDLLGAMRPEMSNDEMKNSLMSVIDKKVQEKTKDAPASSSSIPRFAAFLKKRNEAKPITPGNKDWSKIHEKNFSKFDSIDVYLEKKRKRAEEISASVKKAKNILEEVNTVVGKLKSHKTPQTPQGTENKRPRTSYVNKTTPFKPMVLSTSQMNLNFGAVQAPKTLPHKSPKSVLGSAVKKSINMASRKSTGAVQPRKSTATPFKFTAQPTSGLNVSVSARKKFDLKASLARPLTWKPHKGKLKPIDGKSPVFTKPASVVKVQTSRNKRAEVRANVAQRRANKKQNAQMARRGINI